MRRGGAPPTSREVFTMGMNMAQMMKRARKMQEQLQQAQEQLKFVEVNASAGGGN